MDEPTAVLGVPEQRRVLALIKSLGAQGKGIVFISHNLRDIFEVADKIVVFRRGENAGQRKPSETTHDEIVKLMVGVQRRAALAAQSFPPHAAISFHNRRSGASSSSTLAKRPSGSRKQLSVLSSLTWLTSPASTAPLPSSP
jgi:ABC-type sugar transport system ATPase subunit